MTSSPTLGHQPWGQESWNESWPSRVPMVQIWMLSDEWLSRYELLKNLHIKLCRSVTGMRTRTRKRTTGVTTIALFVIRTGELKPFCQNTCTCSEIAIKTYFQFSYYKSMEILSCHSNESTWATPIKNINFVEANVMNISAKFQLHALYGFRFFNIFSQIYPFGCHNNQSNSAVWTKFICLAEAYSRNISEKFCQNICSLIEIKAYFHFSHYKSMEIISCHGDESA